MATIALNPSSLEFLDREGDYLLGDRRRLASRVSLQRTEPEQLSDAEVAQVLRDSNTYFGRNPLWPWFHWLEAVMVGAAGGSYLGGTACHLDLVQWATKPAQGKLRADVWQRLVDEDRSFLAWQLGQTPARTLVVNGPACVDWLSKERLVDWQEPETLVFQNADGSRGQLVVTGDDQDGKRFIGWNRPLAEPIPAAGRQLLQEWVTAAAGAGNR